MVKFGVAARAALLTEGQLRNWLARYDDLWLTDDRAAGKWREFSFCDCLTLALVREIVALGATVPQASDAAFMALSGRALGDPMDAKAVLISGEPIVWIVPEEAGWIVYENQRQAQMQAAINRRSIVLRLDLAMLASQVARRIRLETK